MVSTMTERVELWAWAVLGRRHMLPLPPSGPLAHTTNRPSSLFLLNISKDLKQASARARALTANYGWCISHLWRWVRDERGQGCCGRAGGPGPTTTTQSPGGQGTLTEGCVRVHFLVLEALQRPAGTPALQAQVLMEENR